MKKLNYTCNLQNKILYIKKINKTDLILHKIKLKIAFMIGKLFSFKSYNYNVKKNLEISNLKCYNDRKQSIKTNILNKISHTNS